MLPITRWQGTMTAMGLAPLAVPTALIALGRQALHAALLGFEHPVTGEELHFESEPPADFAKLQSELAAL